MLLPNRIKFTVGSSRRCVQGHLPLADELGSQMAKNSKLVAKLFFFHPDLVQPAPGAPPLAARGCRDASPGRSGGEAAPLQGSHPPCHSSPFEGEGGDPILGCNQC